MQLRNWQMSQLMRLWYLSHRRPAKAQANLHICAISSEPLLFAHMKYGSRRRVPPKIRHLAPLDGCTCTFEEWIWRTKKYHNLMTWLKWTNLYSELWYTLRGFSLFLCQTIRYYHIAEHQNLVKIWATPWENVSSGVSDQPRHKPACTATQA